MTKIFIDTVKPLPILKSLLKFLPFLLPLAAHAAVGVTPGAGTMLQQAEPVAPPAPASDGTGLKMEQGGAAKLPVSAPFPVNSIRITGNTLFDTTTLHALVADAEGQSLALTQLGEMAARITDYYHIRGYSLARAIIPAQTIRDGVVEISIIEARYGKIELDNRSRVKDSLLEATLAPLQSGQAIEQSALDHSLLLLADIPGVVNSATLRPGELVGTSDLRVGVASGPAVSGNMVLDNYGNGYTGRVRASGTVNFFNPLQHGDIFSMTAMSSGKGMSYGRASYESLLNGRGTRMGGSYSSLNYILGGSLDSLNANGSARVTSLWMQHQLLRSRGVNLYGKIEYDQMQLRDHIDLIDIRTDRHLEKWTASLGGDLRDGILSGGINTWSLGWTSGQVGFDDAAAQSADAATAKTQGGFSKWNAYFSREQGLSPVSTLYFAFAGQWANTNLDAAEKMSAGGPATVRAYDTGVVSGDSGYQGTAEYRYTLGRAWSGLWRAVAFVDSEHVTVNRNTWVTGTNSATLSGAGVGLTWAGPYQWSAKAFVATPFGSTPELVGSNRPSTQTWVEIGMWF